MRSAASPSDERPLAGRTVVVCRAEAEARPLLEELESRGASTVALPLHRLAAPADGGAALDDAIADIDAYTWLAVTSANGVRALASRLGDGIPTSLSVAAVGPATADALAELAIHVDLVPSRATAADLVAAFPIAEAGSRVLAPLNEAAADTLAAGLEAKGYTVDRVDAYRMLPLLD
ncbi:MAG: uroporphyrinogen-III synthase, partial [Acidimicrobiales bacterium]